MKCHKCDKEIETNSKFCSNCGTEVKEKPMHIELEEVVKTCSKAFFIMGYAKGCEKDNKENLSEFEKNLGDSHKEMWEWYKEVLDYFQNWLKGKENEKDKTKNGPK
jgi:hypothetical protein